MDLGTANSIVIHNDQVVVDEPSIVAVDRNNNRIIAVGKRAQMMAGKTDNKNIETVRPLRGGVIADFEMAQHLIRELIGMTNINRSFMPPSLRMVICIPSGITNVEERAVRESAEQAGAKEIRMIHEPMAAAIGIGIDVLEPEGHMIVDIGGGTAEIAVISLGGIVCNNSIRVAGDEFNENVVEYMRKQHNMVIGERTAEQVKIKVGAAVSELDEPPEDYPTLGRDLARVGCRHLPHRYLSGRWRLAAPRTRPAHLFQDQTASPHSRRPPPRRGPRHRHRAEEFLQILLPHPITPAAQHITKRTHRPSGGVSVLFPRDQSPPRPPGAEGAGLSCGRASGPPLPPQGKCLVGSAALPPHFGTARRTPPMPGIDPRRAALNPTATTAA